MTVMSERLKALRQSRNMTQEELAQALTTVERHLTNGEPEEAPTMTAQVISHYESGRRTPRLDGLLAYADYFDTSIDYLIGKTDIADRIEYAGDMLGISPKSAQNLANSTGWGWQTGFCVMDDLLRDDLYELIYTIRDYYLANYTPPPGVQFDVFVGTPSTPEDAYIKEAYEALLKRGFEDIALARIHEVLDARLKRMKAAKDTVRAERKNSPETKAALAEWDKNMREAVARGERIGYIQPPDCGTDFNAE